MAETYISLYRRAANDGVPMGIFMSVMAAALIYADRLPWLVVVVMAMLLMLPCMLYYFQRKMFVAEYGFTEYSGLWMLGIFIMICASLITGLVTWAIFQFVRPGYFYEMAQRGIAFYNAAGDPQSRETAAMLTRVVSGNMLPRPIEMVFSAFWLWSFVGSLLSAVVALVVKKVPLGQQLNHRAE